MNSFGMRVKYKNFFALKVHFFVCIIKSFAEKNFIFNYFRQCQS